MDRTRTMKNKRVLLTIVIALLAVQAGFAGETKDIAFKAECDGTEQRYVAIFPDGFDAEKPVDLLVALHGHGSDRWQYATLKRGSCIAAREFAAKHKMLFVCPDYRAKTSWMGPKAEADVLQIIKEVQDKYAIRRTFLCGGSMGGSSTLTFAAMHPDLLDGIASFNGTANHLEYENFQPYIAKSYGGTKAEIPEEYKKRSAEYWPERFTMPVAVTLGDKDKSVPPDSVRRLTAILKKLGRPVFVIDRPDMGHSSDPADVMEALEFMLLESDKGGE